MSWFSTCWYKFRKAESYFTGIFPNTFLQPVNGGKSSILNCVMKLFMFFFFFIFKKPLKDCPFYSPILLTFWFRYLQTLIKESCIYLSIQLFFKTANKTLEFQEKSKKNAFYSNLQTYIRNIFSSVFTMGSPHRATETESWHYRS